LSESIGDSRAFGLYGLGGLTLGWVWYYLYPRKLSERLIGFACLFAVVVGLGAALGGESDVSLSPALGVYLGVIAGLIINEQLPSPGTCDAHRRMALTARRKDENRR